MDMSLDSELHAKCVPDKGYYCFKKTHLEGILSQLWVDWRTQIHFTWLIVNPTYLLQIA